MFQWKRILFRFSSEYQQLKLVETNPLYQYFLTAIEKEIARICRENTMNDIVLEFRLRPYLDARLTLQLVKRIVERKQVSLGVHVTVRLDVKKRILQCMIPRH
jgi:hypothetical protein